MAAQDPSVTQPGRARTRWLVWVTAAIVGVGIGVGLGFGLRHGSSSPTAAAIDSAQSGPVATWKAGEKRAPSFKLHDAAGAAVSLAAYRGRNVIVTFIDPLCTTFCPRESAVIDQALETMPVADRPAVIAINVNVPIQSGAKLRKEAKRFHWLPQWRWATGSKAQLTAAWSAYLVQVVPTKGDITHTEAAYLVDKNGDQRALFLWPFNANDLLRTYKTLG